MRCVAQCPCIILYSLSTHLFARFFILLSNLKWEKIAIFQWCVCSYAIHWNAMYIKCVNCTKCDTLLLQVLIQNVECQSVAHIYTVCVYIIFLFIAQVLFVICQEISCYECSFSAIKNRENGLGAVQWEPEIIQYIV